MINHKRLSSSNNIDDKIKAIEDLSCPRSIIDKVVLGLMKNAKNNIIEFLVVVGGGSYAKEISWTLSDESEKILLKGGCPVKSSDNIRVNLGIGNYLIKMIDSHGDGWNNNFFRLLKFDGSEFFKCTQKRGPKETLETIVINKENIRELFWNTEIGNKVADVISYNPNCPSKLLNEIYEIGNENQKLNILNNPACPYSIINRVLNGENHNLKQIVLKNPKIKKHSQEHWRSRLKRLGKHFFEIEDMIKLGFINLDGIQGFEEKYDELNRLKERKTNLNEDFGNLEILLKKVQSLRMERIKEKREKRKKEKELEAKLATEKEILRKKLTPTYLGDGVSKGLEYDSIRIGELNKNKMPILKNAGDIIENANIDSEKLAWLCYHRKASTIDHYSHFSIPKRKGGSRLISSPKPLLRKAQKWIMDSILLNVKINSAATGFITGKSIVDNAKMHQRKKVIIKMDIKDFFPSIKFNRVKGMFYSFGYSEGVSTILALITTESERKQVLFQGKKYFIALDKRKLPQGACTSPAISNIISRGIDNRLHGLSIKMGWEYTRYADDMVFSTNDNLLSIKAMIKTVKSIIFDEGFELNDKKTVVMRPHQRQVVTGIVVNDKMKVSRRDIRRYRAFLHQYNKLGKLEMTRKIGKDAEYYAKGYLSYISMINKEQADNITSKYPWLIDN